MWQEINGTLVNLECFSRISWDLFEANDIDELKDKYKLFGISKVTGEEVVIFYGKSEKVEAMYEKIARRLLGDA
jgi:hypothetical protein